MTVGGRYRHVVLIMTISLAVGCTEVGEPRASFDFAWTADTVAVIGKLDGEAHETFGRLITGAFRDPHGLFVVDLQSAMVLRYAADGRFLGMVAQRGQGPGELGLPLDLDLAADGTLLVLDNGNARISRFDLEGDAVVYRDAVPTTIPTGTLCRMEGRTFRGGLSSGHVLHELGPGGTIRRSLGPAPELEGGESYGAFRSLAEAQALSGRVHCAEDEGIVLVALSSHPLVRAYTTDGSLRWEKELPDIHPVTFAITEGGAFQAEIDPVTGTSFLRSIVPWEDGTILLQLEIRMPGSPPADRDFHRLESRLIDVETGEEVGRTLNLPWIVARSGERFALISNTPYPQVILVDARW